MASDRLFEMLAQAEGQPSHTLRAVESAGQAGNDILGGYMGGKEIQQKLEQYKLLSTPLGQMYSDPSQIPFGLSPQHTVKDLITLAPAMENYVPSNLIRGAAGAYGANIGGGGAPPPSAPPVQDMSPRPANIPGAANPAPPPGTTALTGVEGVGGGGGGYTPPGTPPGLTMDIPAGGMGMKGFQNVVLPALKASQEERQFGLKQGAEESRFERGQNAEESRFQRGKIAGAAETAGKNLATTGTIQDDINVLRNLYKGYNPPAFIGSVGAAISGASGKSNWGNPWMVQGNKIGQITPGLGAKINYELTHRFSPGESTLLMAKVAPSPTDSEDNANTKLNNLQRLTQVFQSGDINSINMVASAIAGQRVQVNIPTSQTQLPLNSAGSGPRIRVRNRQTGQTGTVAVNKFDPIRYEKI